MNNLFPPAPTLGQGLLFIYLAIIMIACPIVVSIEGWKTYFKIILLAPFAILMLIGTLIGLAHIVAAIPI